MLPIWYMLQRHRDIAVYMFIYAILHASKPVYFLSRGVVLLRYIITYIIINTDHIIV